MNFVEANQRHIKLLFGLQKVSWHMEELEVVLEVYKWHAGEVLIIMVSGSLFLSIFQNDDIQKTREVPRGCRDHVHHVHH